ncbi:hypothetical protein LTR36_010003 [Oleoguttula mirabilis]|uniref:tRNA (uracil-O(2)-)-methyltransferase n=1 Tax=Oleoguttula mirabilis TaxID=1507867 RepID=A0AAV9JRN7_9PEZI|nr:hypothetical protein LTR36_010003 [Oleoguttula mirabilis]
MEDSSSEGPDDATVCGQPLADQAKFQPIDRTRSSPSLHLPDDRWMTVLETQCTFPPEIFHGVMLNLVKNPNITSSHLFRADIFYDSGDNAAHDHEGGTPDLLKHLKAEYRPLTASLPDYELIRTIVRQLIPRNPQLDRPLVQTCHFFQKLGEHEECNVVLYVPHAQQADDMPFYHPAVAKLAFLHSWRYADNDPNDDPQALGSISVSYSLFPNTTLTTKLERTALRLLQTVHKHGQGQLAGYEKRVHLDQIIPQKRYQDTYAKLKAKYGRQLAEQWVEVTDPGKHVFEDIGIAAFLIELWRDMYDLPAGDAAAAQPDDSSAVDSSDKRDSTPFPGFVDIGCGNGLLVYILLSEGYPGWGFDARQRKTWSIFPSHIQDRLKQQLLVPDIFTATSSASSESQSDTLYHNGVFEPGTFIVSNHADELTPWTPLLAYQNNSAFIAIPCCSRDLSGARFRAPPTTKATKQVPARLPQQETITPQQSTPVGDGEQSLQVNKAVQAAETGSLKRTEAQKKMPSAYSTLCSYVSSLAEEVGFEAEREVLRIPSTRNQCIVGGRRKQNPAESGRHHDEGRRDTLVAVVERELGKSIEVVGKEWVERAEKLAKKPGSGH